MTQNLVNQIINQHGVFAETEDSSAKVKAEIQKEKREREEKKVDFVKSQLSGQKLRVYEAITEKGASTWLNALPLKDHDLYLDKMTFRDSIFLRYDIPLPRLPTHCVCGANYTMEHALSCRKGNRKRG